MKLREFFAARKGPLSILYRVNAGAVPAEGWIADQDISGGRVIGEMCHFVDWMMHMVGAAPERVFARAMTPFKEGRGARDDVVAQLFFPDGSLGTVVYAAGGDTSYSKERIEVFGEHAVAVIDDFRSVELVRNARRHRTRQGRQDKGYAGEIDAFISACLKGGQFPIPVEEIIQATRVTFALVESANTGVTVQI